MPLQALRESYRTHLLMRPPFEACRAVLIPVICVLENILCPNPALSTSVPDPLRPRRQARLYHPTTNRVQPFTCNLYSYTSSLNMVVLSLYPLPSSNRQAAYSLPLVGRDSSMLSHRLSLLAHRCSQMAGRTRIASPLRIHRCGPYPFTLRCMC